MLVNEGVDSQPLISHLADIEKLSEDVNGLYINALDATQEEASKIEKQRRKLTSEIGYNIIGVPFTNHDAELYALDKGLDYTVLELHGNTGKPNAAKDETKDSYVHMRVSRGQKAAWVKQAQAKGLKLAEWITKKLNEEL